MLNKILYTKRILHVESVYRHHFNWMPSHHNTKTNLHPSDPLAEILNNRLQSISTIKKFIIIFTQL